MSAVDGGAGGVGALEIRYSLGFPHGLWIAVNGVERVVTLPDVGNSPSWRHTNWGRLRLENVVLGAGSTNTIELFPDDPVEPYPDISIDDVVVSTADELALAQSHRQVLDLAAVDRAALLAYLRQLDSPAATCLMSIFCDGFESGDVSAWSP